MLAKIRAPWVPRAQAAVNIPHPKTQAQADLLRELAELFLQAPEAAAARGLLLPMLSQSLKGLEPAAGEMLASKIYDIADRFRAIDAKYEGDHA